MLSQKQQHAADKAKTLLDNAFRQRRDLTPSEDTEFRSLLSQLNKVDVQREKKRLDRLYHESRTAPGMRFENFGEYLFRIAEYRQGKGTLDGRLLPYRAEARGMQFQEGGLGGFAVPTSLLAEMMLSAPMPAIVRPRSTILSPAGAFPDVAATIPSLDQGSQANDYGGISFFHTDEADDMTETGFKLREVTLKPEPLVGYVTVSNKLLQNWRSGSAAMARIFMNALNGAEDADFLTGDGVFKSLGIVKSPASIKVKRATVGQIADADIRNMMQSVLLSESLVWIAAPSAFGQISPLLDSGTGRAQLLKTYPVLWSRSLPVLGQTGDLCLCDLGYYLIKDGTMAIETSDKGSSFLLNRTIYRIKKYVTGEPWISAPIPRDQSGSGSMASAFVVLDGETA